MTQQTDGISKIIAACEAAPDVKATPGRWLQQRHQVAKDAARVIETVLGVEAGAVVGTRESSLEHTPGLLAALLRAARGERVEIMRTIFNPAARRIGPPGGCPACDKGQVFVTESCAWCGEGRPGVESFAPRVLGLRVAALPLVSREDALVATILERVSALVDELAALVNLPQLAGLDPDAVGEFPIALLRSLSEHARDLAWKAAATQPCPACTPDTAADCARCEGLEYLRFPQPEADGEGLDRARHRVGETRGAE